MTSHAGQNTRSCTHIQKRTHSKTHAPVKSEPRTSTTCTFFPLPSLLAMVCADRSTPESSQPANNSQHKTCEPVDLDQTASQTQRPRLRLVGRPTWGRPTTQIYTQPAPHAPSRSSRMAAGSMKSGVGNAAAAFWYSLWSAIASRLFVYLWVLFGWGIGDWCLVVGQAGHTATHIYVQNRSNGRTPIPGASDRSIEGARGRYRSIRSIGW